MWIDHIYTFFLTLIAGFCLFKGIKIRYDDTIKSPRAKLRRKSHGKNQKTHAE